MAKQLTFTYEDKAYTLEFNRRVVRDMERKGFSIESANDQMFATMVDLWDAAFSMHHPNLPNAVKDEIYEAMPDKGDLFAKLMEMFGDTVQTLLGEPEESKAKKMTWAANW